MSGIIAVYGLVVAVLLAGQCKSYPPFLLIVYLFVFIYTVSPTGGYSLFS